MSRAHVTEVRLLLTMGPEAKDMVLALGDPLQGSALPVHTLQRLCNLSAEEPQRIDRIWYFLKGLNGYRIATRIAEPAMVGEAD